MLRKLKKEQETIRSQLSLHAVVWDMMKTGYALEDRLEEEMELFGVSVFRTEHFTSDGSSQKKYESAVHDLYERGILTEKTLLITDDENMAKYVYQLRDTDDGCGMGVIYYEQAGSRSDVSADMIVLGFEETGVQFFDRVLKRRNGIPWNILYTKRTNVREITLADLDELYALYEGEGITDYTEPLYERKTEEEYTSSYISHMYYYYGYGMWIVRDKKTGALIGRAGIEHRDVEGETVMELGYIIGKEHQQKGYATEVCQAIVAYAKEVIGLEELYCFIHPDNKVSCHLAQNLGFETTDRFDSEKERFVVFCKKLKEL